MRPGTGAHGQLWGLFPHLSIPVFRLDERLELFFRVGTGLGYAQRPHDSFDNPSENALGSYWNNITQFKLGANMALGQHYQLGIGGHLTHFSNGGFELPNYGMNIPGAYISVGYLPKKITKQRFSTQKTDKSPAHRWGAALQTSAARIEYVAVDGPKYLLWSASVAGTYMLHRYNRWYVGIETEYNAGAAAWLHNNTLLGNDREDAVRGARRLGVFLAYTCNTAIM
jgi:hypothetical protein